MPRRVFFSFHYKDIWQVSQVRNAGIARRDVEPNVPVDHAAWESIQRRGAANVKKWIDQELKGSGVTVVLIGKETFKRPYCLYEIESSLNLNKGLLGIYIHNIKNNKRETSSPGRNPLEEFTIQVNEPILFWDNMVEKRASEVFKTYDWVSDNGYQNFHDWVDEAAKIAGR